MKEIRFSITEDEKKLIEEMAKYEDRTPSDYCRHVVLKKAKYDKETFEMFDPSRVIHKVAREFKNIMKDDKDGKTP
jgi:3-methyladenine DNA glycosylase Tag